MRLPLQYVNTAIHVPAMSIVLAQVLQNILLVHFACFITISICKIGIFYTC